MSQEKDYRPLLPSYTDNFEPERDECQRIQGQKRIISLRLWRAVCIIWQFLPWILTLTLSTHLVKTRSWGTNRFQQTKLLPAQLTFSPAQDEIQYEVRVFEQNLIDAPRRFIDPDTVDEAWSNLYNFGISSVSRSVASKMTNQTSNIMLNKPDDYIVELDVFHQLHCLNMVRQALEPTYKLKDDARRILQKLDGASSPRHDDRRRHTHTPTNNEFQANPSMLDAEHLNHCLNSLRQSIQCHGDVAPVVWHWDEDPGDGRKPFNRGFLSVAHTCRNFERLRDWAKERTIHGDLSYDVRPEGEDLNIPIWP